MDDYLAKVEDFSDQQKIRFRKGLGADLAFLILILLLIFVNIYTCYYKDTGNTPRDALLIFIALWFFFGWCVYKIVDNSLGWWQLRKLDDQLGDIRAMKSDSLKVKTYLFLSGSYYDVIDKNISEYVAPLQFHRKKKKENLLSLNIRYAIWEFLIGSTGVGMFVCQVIYDKGANFHTWEPIFGLVIMIVFVLIVLGYLIPRQFIINRHIKLDDMNKISEAAYYDTYKFFYIEKVLTKFWNRETKE